MSDDSDEILCLGISADTGHPLPDLTPEGLSALVGQATRPDPEREILERRADPGLASFGVVSEILDPNDLAEAGWGVVFARDCDPAVRQALAPLLGHRQAQAGELFKVLDGPAPGEPASAWIARNGATLDVVDPFKGIPYFLLLIGSPESIPFEFQYTLDIYWAVGRLWFPSVEEYARYAQGVVTYETAPTVATRRQVALFATAHDFDRATQLFTKKVAGPLIDPAGRYGALGSRQKFALRPCLGADATKENLAKILTGEGGGGVPALLLSGTHGMAFNLDDERQTATQGALVCQDWDGYGAITADHWFAAADLPAAADLRGLIHFCFACYSAGCPREDNFARTATGPRPIAERPMIARLPQAMLAHPGGGALASLGHIDRAWAYSFTSERNAGQEQGMRDVVARLLAGQRIGQATDQLNIRWSALSTDLSELLQDLKYGGQVPDRQLAQRWIARDDARNYVILGDPAVRLRVDAMPPAGG